VFHKALLAGLILTGAMLSAPALADACNDRGTILDSLAGSAIAHDMACADRRPAMRAYDQSFRAPVGRRAEWKRGPNRGYIFTHREYYQGRRLCRDFTQVTYRKGRQFDRAGTACQRRDGAWEFV
jgi:surface antigen